MFSITNNKYIDINSDSNSYGIELTVFNSNANSTTNSNSDYNTNSSVNYSANSITKSNNAYEAPA